MRAFQKLTQILAYWILSPYSGQPMECQADSQWRTGMQLFILCPSSFNTFFFLPEPNILISSFQKKKKSFKVQHIQMSGLRRRPGEAKFNPWEWHTVKIGSRKASRFTKSYQLDNHDFFFISFYLTQKLKGDFCPLLHSPQMLQVSGLGQDETISLE